jgi:Uma2 family endonuclease
MSSLAQPTRLMTLEEYLAGPDVPERSELVRGEVIEMPPPSVLHAAVMHSLSLWLGLFIHQKQLGRLLVGDAGVITSHDPDSVRGADLAFYRAERVPQEFSLKPAYLNVPPDLVIEIRSPSERRSQVLQKVTEYLAAGVRVVCVIHLENRTAEVYREDRGVETISAEGVLTFPDVLPGFGVSMAQVFA